jgi:hypothetical protein
MRFKWFATWISILLCSSLAAARAEADISLEQAFETVKQDYRNFYTPDRGLRALGAFSIGAVIAHTNLDSEFQDWYQDDFRNSQTDELANVAKVFGEKVIMMPASLLLASLQLQDSDSNVGKWGERTFRAYLVGGPVIGAVQPLTGASRPRDGNGSEWNSFNDDNGVSGHAFVGAVPFLTLARMEHLTDTQRNIAYAASALTAWSRVNDDAHYLSQALLGWYVAWESVDAVNSVKETGKWYSISPYAFGDGFGLSLNITW